MFICEKQPGLKTSVIVALQCACMKFSVTAVEATHFVVKHSVSCHVFYGSSSWASGKLPRCWELLQSCLQIAVERYLVEPGQLKMFKDYCKASVSIQVWASVLCWQRSWGIPSLFAKQNDNEKQIHRFLFVFLPHIYSVKVGLFGNGSVVQRPKISTSTLYYSFLLLFVEVSVTKTFSWPWALIKKGIAGGEV